MRAWLTALVLSAVGAALMLGPILGNPAETMVCGWVHPDCLGNHWLLVWVAEQVLSGGSLLHNDRYYWPIGDAPWLAGNGSDGFLYLPWHLLLDWPQSTAAHSFTLLVFNGLGGFALARAAGASTFSAYAAAITTAMMVFGGQELGAGRFSQTDFGFLAFFLSSWLRFLHSPSTGRGVVAGCLLAATSILYWYYGLFGVIAGAVLGAFRLPALFLAPRGWIVPVAAFVATYLVLAGPMAWVFAAHYASIPGVAEVDAFPHPEAAGDSCWPAVPFLVGVQRHAGRALPFTTSVLAALSLLLRRDRMVWSLWALVLCFGGLMAGSLWPGGPYEMLYGIAGPLRRFWWPYRHVVVLNLALITLAALAADRLWARLPKRFQGNVLAFFIAASIPLQLTAAKAPFHVLHSTVQVPAKFYERVGELPGTVMLELPLSPRLASSQAPLAYQLQHRKTLLNGHAMWVDRVRPDGWDTFIAGNSFLAQWGELEQARLTGTFRFKADDLLAVRERGLAIISANPEYIPFKMGALNEAYRVILTALFGEPVVIESQARAWLTSGYTGITEVTFTPFEWPQGVGRVGPNLPLGAQRPPSLSFTMPMPKQPPRPK